MTDQEINIAIAGACGWRQSERNIAHWHHVSEPYSHILFGDLPEYCNDLNAMHEAEKLFELSAKFGAHDYAANLYHICVPRDMQHDDHFICWVVAFYLLNATARQRAEAFLRTLGKWEEAK